LEAVWNLGVKNFAYAIANFQFNWLVAYNNDCVIQLLCYYTRYVFLCSTGNVYLLENTAEMKLSLIPARCVSLTEFFRDAKMPVKIWASLMEQCVDLMMIP
jgi:hypothetical protein